jgi:hypothetical protein
MSTAMNGTWSVEWRGRGACRDSRPDGRARRRHTTTTRSRGHHHHFATSHEDNLTMAQSSARITEIDNTCQRKHCSRWQRRRLASASCNPPCGTRCGGAICIPSPVRPLTFGSAWRTSTASVVAWVAREASRWWCPVHLLSSPVARSDGNVALGVRLPPNATPDGWQQCPSPARRSAHTPTIAQHHASWVSHTPSPPAIARSTAGGSVTSRVQCVCIG